MYTVPPQLQASNRWAPEFHELWAVECLAKSKYVASLIVDSTEANPLTRMSNSAVAHGGETPELGDEITQLAQRLMDM